ncbi:MAG TPA: bifunctional 4-hydroxy-2-oxoglutarate aldolase/2-dehydro-3-deoxy-phosphogluconate aldolase [Candidatus Acidoferrales bacterium]|nr:bifunctional 4-hydroxy-2-oxoglutarate aldolase/2-dehydro-3-deoxy-phosphogluconate aldolase [Candidatus Acidoferrales bacterium]
MNKDQIVKSIIDAGAVAVIRLSDSKKLLRVAEAIYRGGVSGIEITMTVPNAIQVIENASREIGSYMILGVGTVLDPETAKRAIDAGATYVVSPIFKKEIIDVAHRNGVPAMPGAFTPTEIQTAYECGADIVKVFPADVVGMPFFKGILAPMPHLRLMPTGGVTLTNAGDWLKAGACAVGVGTALLDKNAIASENYQVLTDNAKVLMESISNARGERRS